MRVILIFVNSHPDERAQPRKQPVQDRSRQTVDRILGAAARIFTERGYPATTTNHMAEAAGVSIGSLYQYFPNKDALLVALEERHLVRARHELRRAAARWQSDEPSLEDWCGAFVDVLEQVNDDPLHLLLSETAPTPPHLQELIGEVVAEIAADVAQQLRRWRRPDPELRARVLVVTALRLVHDLVIPVPKGQRRRRVRHEVIHLLTAYAAA